MAILTEEMTKYIGLLADTVKNDPRHAELMDALEEYERSEELNSLIAMYNDQQDILQEEYSSQNPDNERKEKAQELVPRLYIEITEHPVYTGYMRKKEAFDSLFSEIGAELQYQITGSRPCSHDCSSCHSGCSHAE